MSVIRENDKYSPDNCPRNWRQGRQQQFLGWLEWRVIAPDAVRVQKDYDSENQQCKKCMHEVPDPKPIRRKVLWRGSRPKASPRHNPVARHPIVADVAVGEGGEAAQEAACHDQDARQVLVDGVATAVVGEKRVEELEQENRASWEEFDEVAYAREAWLC